MDYTCRKCGHPVKNKEQYDLFEGMHWLCFHLEFEHGEYDVDEACDDPSCPWNLISGGNIDKINTYADVMIKSESLKSSLYLNLKAIEPMVLPSRVIQISFYDENFRAERISWFEDNEIRKFIEELELLVDGKNIICNLSSMSPNEFELRIKKLNSRGYFLVELEFETNFMLKDFKSEISYKVNFDILQTGLYLLIESFRHKIMK